MKQGGAAVGASLLAGSSLSAIPRLLGASPAPDPRMLEKFADIPGVKELMNAALLIRANAAAMKAKNVKYVSSGFFFVKDERNYANTDGTVSPRMIGRRPRSSLSRWHVKQAM